MKIDDAIELIRSAGPAEGEIWVDFGAGEGLFTLALAALLGPQGRVVAVDRDRVALERLRRVVRRPARRGAELVVVEGDFGAPEGLAGLDAVLRATVPRRRSGVDGVLFANALHFHPQPVDVLGAVADRLRTGGRVVIVEYDRHAASRWVPYPIPFEALGPTLDRVGFGAAERVAVHPSAYQGEMYCAVATFNSARGSR